MTRDEFNKSFTDVCKLFHNLSVINSRTGKTALLKNYPDKDFLQRILLYTYNPYFVYGIHKKTFENFGTKGICYYNNAFDLLDSLRADKGTDNEAKDIVTSYVHSFPSGESDWMMRIFLKDLLVGINISTINSVFPKLVPDFKVALCETFESPQDLRGNAFIVQPKLDGVRCIAIVKHGGGVELYTRNGTKISGYDDIESALDTPIFYGRMFDGEIMGSDFDNTMEGLFALAKRKEAVYTVFDGMTLEQFNARQCNIPYAQRLANVEELINDTIDPCIELIVSKKFYLDELLGGELDETNELYVAQGYEGTVVKDSYSPYNFKRSYAWVKYKKMITEEFDCVDFEEGDGRFLGTLGAIVVSTSSGKFVKVGSGFSDEQRNRIWNNQDDYSWHKVEVKFQEYTKDGSLRFPTFVKFRDDK